MFKFEKMTVDEWTGGWMMGSQLEGGVVLQADDR